MPDNSPVLAVVTSRREGVEIWCCDPRCRRDVYLTPDQANALLGAHRTFVEIQRALICSNCGALGREGMVRLRGSILDDSYYRTLERQARELRDHGQIGTVDPKKPAHRPYEGPVKRDPGAFGGVSKGP